MENHSLVIIDNIKQELEVDFTLILQSDHEAEVDDSLSHEQLTSKQIVNNIKHEPEEHFTLTLPEDSEPEIEQMKELKIVLRKFDRTWATKSEMFESCFGCGKCDYANKQSNNLKHHLKNCKFFLKCERCGLMSKSEITTVKCEDCDLTFDCNNCKTNHYNHDHYDGSNWICTKCDFKTSIRTSLRRHFQSHVKKFSCDTCKQNFAFSHLLRDHQQQHRHGVFATATEIKFECKICARSFATKNGLNRHEKQVHSEMKFHCDICGKISKTKDLIRSHIQIHLKVPGSICQHMLSEHRRTQLLEFKVALKYKCELCVKTFKHSHSLTRHMETHSKDPCPTCQHILSEYRRQKLIYKVALPNHEKNVHSQMEFKCEQCKKTFKHKRILAHHMETHIKVYCPICQHMLAHHRLNKHIEQHSTLAQIECDICKKVFNYKNHLEIHKRNKHDQERIQIQCEDLQIKCDLCATTFKNNVLLEIHMSQHEVVPCIKSLSSTR